MIVHDVMGRRCAVSESACGCLCCSAPLVVLRLCPAHYDYEITTRAQLDRIMNAPTWSQHGPAREVSA